MANVSDERRLVFLSDTHLGSASGLLPPSFETSEGIIQPQNAGQQYLWDCWLNFCSRVKQFQPDAVIVDGDVVEGVQPKDGGAGLSLRMMVDQKRAAKSTLDFVKATVSEECRWYFCQGTKYHVGESGEAEEEIARMLGAERYQSVGSGILVREVLWLYIKGVIIEVAHAIGGATGFYRATNLDRELQWSALSGKDETKGVPKADLLVRAHRHYFMTLGHASKQGVILPCWQLQTKYARRDSVHRFHPDIGGVFVIVTPAAKERGEPPCEIIQQLYDIPPVPLTRME